MRRTDAIAVTEDECAAVARVGALHIEPMELDVVSARADVAFNAESLALKELNCALNRQLATIATNLLAVAAAAITEAAPRDSAQTRQLHGLKALEPERRHNHAVLGAGTVVARHAALEAPRAEDVAEAVEKVRVRTHVRPAEPGSHAVHDAVRVMEAVERCLNLAQLVVVLTRVGNLLLKVLLHARLHVAEPLEPPSLEQRLLELQLARLRGISELEHLGAEHSLLLWRRMSLISSHEPTKISIL